MKRVFISALLCLAVTVTTSGVASAFAYGNGNVFASTGSGTVMEYDSGGVWQQTLSGGTMSGFMTGSSFDAAGNFYVTGFSDAKVYQFDTNGAYNGTFGTGYQAGTESILFDAAGHAYVGAADGDRDIRKMSSSGNLLAQYDVAVEARGSDWIDLAADQTTMFYTSEDYGIKRYDVSTGTQLADFATLSNRPSFALRLLGDGGLLVANNDAVRRLDAAGNVVNTYDVAGVNDWFALNLDGDGTTFWSAGISGGKIRRFNIATGALTSSFDAGTDIYGLSVFGEITQSSEVPEPSVVLLLGLGLVGLFARKRLRSS